MLSLHPQFIKDETGQNSFVVLSANEYNNIMEIIEDLEDVKLFDEVISDPNNNFVDFDKFKEELGL